MKKQCAQCGVCCSYITVSLDEPEDHEDYDEILWYLYHENIKVYIADDEDEGWYAEIKTKCKAMKDNGDCGAYEVRPTVCRDHDADECENHGEGSPYKFEFNEPEEFLSYLKLKKINYTPGKPDVKP